MSGAESTAAERECRCPCHQTSVNGVLAAHTGSCSCTVMSAEAVELLNEVRDGDTTRLHALMDADPLPTEPDAGDVEALLADSFGEWLHRMHGVASSCDHLTEARGLLGALQPWLATLLADARREGEVKARDEAADFMPAFRDAQQPATYAIRRWLRDRAARIGGAS